MDNGLVHSLSAAIVVLFCAACLIAHMRMNAQVGQAAPPPDDHLSMRDQLTNVCVSSGRLDRMSRYFHALSMVESSGGVDTRVGAAGEIGPFQITRDYWADAVASKPQIGGTHADCADLRYAMKVIIVYAYRYEPEAWRREDYRTLASLHHSGPAWRTRPDRNAAYIAHLSEQAPELFP